MSFEQLRDLADDVGLRRRVADGGAIPEADAARALAPHMFGPRRRRTRPHMRRIAVQRQCRPGRGRARVPEYRLGELRHPIGVVRGAWLSLLHIAAGEPRYSFTLPYYPGASQGCRAVRARYRKINDITGSETVALSRRGLFGSRCRKECFPKLFGMLYCKAQNSRENARFVLSSRMIRVEAVAGKLLSLDDRLVSTRQLHDGKATMTVQGSDASAWRRQLTPNNRLERTALLSARARHEAASEQSDQTLMEVPTDLVPAVRELIAKHRKAS
jgi:hypothetical protein